MPEIHTAPRATATGRPAPTHRSGLTRNRFHPRRATGVLVAALIAASAMTSTATLAATDAWNRCRAAVAHTDAVAALDGAGRCVRLAQPAQRVAALAPHLVENLAAAGRLATLVARSERADEPREATAVPSVASHDRVDRERLLATAPDLVLAWAAALPSDFEDWLNHHGIALYVSDPKKLSDVEHEIATLARLVAVPDDAYAVTQPTPLPAPRRAVETVDAVHLLWPRPLMVSGNDPLLNDVLAHCGLRNVFADTRRAAISIDPERLFVARPRRWIIGVSGWDGPALGRASTSPAVAPYRGLPGFDAANAIVLDADRLHRPTRRLYAAVDALCAAAAELDDRDAATGDVGRHHESPTARGD